MVGKAKAEDPPSGSLAQVTLSQRICSLLPWAPSWTPETLLLLAGRARPLSRGMAPAQASLRAHGMPDTALGTLSEQAWSSSP